MRIFTLRNLLALPIALTMAACSTTPPPHTTGGAPVHERSQGYSLLYKLVGDDSQVGKIFYIKSADKTVEDLVKQVGAMCQTAKDQLDEFAKKDKQLEYDLADLPYIEQRGRDLEAKDQEHALLFSSGKEFELKLIFTQVQAMGYCRQMCRALDEKETDPARKVFLENLAARSGDLHDALIKFLTVTQ